MLAAIFENNPSSRGRSGTMSACAELVHGQPRPRLQVFGSPGASNINSEREAAGGSTALRQDNRRIDTAPPMAGRASHRARRRFFIMTELSAAHVRGALVCKLHRGFWLVPRPAWARMFGKEAAGCSGYWYRSRWDFRAPCAYFRAIRFVACDRPLAVAVEAAQQTGTGGQQFPRRVSWIGRQTAVRTDLCDRREIGMLVAGLVFGISTISVAIVKEGRRASISARGARWLIRKTWPGGTRLAEGHLAEMGVEIDSGVSAGGSGTSRQPHLKISSELPKAAL